MFQALLGLLVFALSLVLSPTPATSSGLGMQRTRRGTVDHRDPQFRLVAHAISGDPVGLKKALRDGADPHADDEHGRRALHAAVKHGAGHSHHEVVEALLAEGVEVDPALVVNIASSGQTRTLRAMLDAGGDMNAQGGTYRLTPLMWAVRHEDPEMTAMLLERGADQTPVDSKNRTALDVAKMIDNAQILALFGERVHRGGSMRKPWQRPPRRAGEHEEEGHGGADDDDDDDDDEEEEEEELEDGWEYYYEEEEEEEDLQEAPREL